MGLSVYNALSLAGRDLPAAAIESVLRANFDANLPDDYVLQGIGFLAASGLASVENGVVRIPRRPDGRGRTVVRSADDRSLHFVAGT